MFKRCLVTFMVFAITLFQANAGNSNQLKAVFDDFTYALTVEWDQEDQQFYQHQTKLFGSKIQALQEAGLSNQELLDFTFSQIQDENMARDLKNLVTSININNMNSEEAARYVSEHLNNTYGQGASWSGGAVFTVLGVIFFVAVAAIVFGYARPGNGCYEVYRCETNCNAVYCWEDCGYKCI